MTAFMTTGIEDVISAVCEEFECTPEQLKCSKRNAAHSHARIAAAYFLRDRLKNTLQRVGIELNRDHSTIVYLLKKVEDYRFTKHETYYRIARIEQKLFNQTK